MNEQKRLIQNTGIIAIGNLSTKLVSFFLLPLYTSILTTSEYGIVDYIVSISTFCVPFISLLMDESMFRFLIDCKNERQKSKVISTSMIIILSGGGIFLCVAIPILLYIRYEYTIYFLLYIISSVVSTMMSAFLRGIGRTDQYAVFNFMTSFVKILLNIVFIAILYLGVEGMMLASIIAQIAVSGIYFVITQLWLYLDFKQIEEKRVKEMIKYSIPLIPNKVSWSIINLSDRIIIMNYMGSNYSGLYAVSYKFPTLMDTIYSFFYQSWKESSARVMGDSDQNIFYNSVYNYLKNFMYSVVLGMIAFMPLVFHFLVNPSYQDAILYVPILLMATYFSNISGFYGGIFTAYKDTKIMGTTTIVAACINLMVNFCLIHMWGLYAAAFSTLLANLVVCFYRRIKVRKYIVLQENYRKKLFSCVVTVFVLIMFYCNRYIYTFIGCLISVVYALLMNQSLVKTILRQLMSRRK